MAGGIEFLSDDLGDTPPPEPPPSPRERRTTLLRGAVVAVAVVALGIWVATRPGGTGTTASRPVVTVTPTATPTSVPPASPTPDTRQVVCRSGTPVDSDVSAAIRSHIPKLVLDNLHSMRCVRGSGATGRIVTETVTGSVGPSIVVEVDLFAKGIHGVPVTAVAHERDGVALLYSTESESAGLVADVSVYGRDGAGPAIDIGTLADYLALNIVL